MYSVVQVCHMLCNHTQGRMCQVYNIKLYLMHIIRAEMPNFVRRTTCYFKIVAIHQGVPDVFCLLKDRYCCCGYRVGSRVGCD